MQEKMKQIDQVMIDKLDTAILKQSIRDLASKDSKLRDKAILFFSTESFDDFCTRNKFKDANKIKEGISSVLSYPLLSRKLIVEQICRLLDSSIK
jgi:site-specific recombinase XerD